jgi:hypothetical protein
LSVRRSILYFPIFYFLRVYSWSFAGVINAVVVFRDVIGIYDEPDAINHRTDSMVIVSGDSDLEPAVEWVRKNHPTIKVSVYIPALPVELNLRRNDNYQRMQVNCRLLPLSEIPRHLLPATVTSPDGTTVQRPTPSV